MKRGVLIILSFFVFYSNINAKTFELNPDKYVSIGVSYNGTSKEYASNQESILPLDQEGQYISETIMTDLRVPVSNSVTFNFAIGRNLHSLEWKETNYWSAIKTDGLGLSYRIGVRFYFNQKY